LQTLSAREEDNNKPRLAKANGFSLHAGVAAQTYQRRKLERLCRYIARPAVSTERMALTDQGNIRYTLKTPYRDGTTHIVLEPLDFMARLAALVPKPRVNLTRFHGVFAPNSRLRKQITLKARRQGSSINDAVKSPAQRQTAMSWAQRLKRVFNIDIETCSQCGGTVKIIACIEDPTVIKQILDHLSSKSIKPKPHPVRAPPKDTQPVLS
jgi:hypothetical protein